MTHMIQVHHFQIYLQLDMIAFLEYKHRVYSRRKTGLYLIFILVAHQMRFQV